MYDPVRTNPPAPPRGDPSPGPLRLETTSDPVVIADVRRAVEGMAERAGFDAKAVADVGLCVNEAIANVIRHAYAGAAGRPVVITADVQQAAGGGAGGHRPPPHAMPSCGLSDCPPTCLRVTIRDWGNAVDPSKLPPRAPDPETPGGLGLICLRELMDSVVFTPQPDGMLLTLTKRKR
jgi:serine/threonine-protein kinase RsbW